MGRLLFICGLCVFTVYAAVVLGINPLWTVAAFAVGAAGLMLIILVHELGHVAVGSLEGLPLRGVGVGPLMVDVSKGWRHRRSPYGGMVGGYATFDLGGLSDTRFMDALGKMSAGGPVAGLLLAVVCLDLKAVVPEAHLREAGWLCLLDHRQSL